MSAFNMIWLDFKDFPRRAPSDNVLGDKHLILLKILEKIAKIS